MESNTIFFSIVGNWRTVIGQTCHVSQFSNCKNDAAKVGGGGLLSLFSQRVKKIASKQDCRL